MENTFLFVEKYRPTKINDCILTKQLKETFSKFVEQKHIPNLLLTGGAGRENYGCESNGKRDWCNLVYDKWFRGIWN